MAIVPSILLSIYFQANANFPESSIIKQLVIQYSWK